MNISRVGPDGQQGCTSTYLAIGSRQNLSVHLSPEQLSGYDFGIGRVRWNRNPRLQLDHRQVEASEIGEAERQRIEREGLFARRCVCRQPGSARSAPRAGRAASRRRGIGRRVGEDRIEFVLERNVVLRAEGLRRGVRVVKRIAELLPWTELTSVRPQRPMPTIRYGSELAYLAANMSRTPRNAR